MLPMTRNDTDDDALKRRQEDAQRQTEADNRARDGARRNMFNLFDLWTVCPDKRCLRARSCRGDVDICLRDRWFVHVSAEARALLGKTIELVGGGMPWREALNAANADMERRLKILADVEARYGVKMPERGAPLPASIARHMHAAPPAPAAPSPVLRAAPPPHRGPRVRGF